ncbi:hypothetical protein BDW59DRAFT_157751 [Aspergillus cavernicola]|uniref:Uncharacterized protein n=1 Tax=Aspergillus cavernicola TaxID=176166 RepID=A0ABR4IVM0_9EURO
MPFILFLLLALTSSTTAIVVGTDVSSSFNSDDLVQCLPYNKGLISTTTAAFTSRYSNPLLTWTEAIYSNPNPDSDADDLATVRREFYFGYSPSNSSGPSTSFHACTLFFYDASSLPDATPDDSQTALNWGKELPNDCVVNLITHIDSAAQRTIVQSDQDVSTFCRQQQIDLLDYHVDSCPGFSMNITDINAFTTNLSQSGNCSLRTGESYNLRLIDMLEPSSPEETPRPKKLVQGTTPVITILFPTSGLNTSEPETHYTVLKAERNVPSLLNGKTYKPSCFWIGGPRQDTGRPTNDFPQGIGLHIIDFDSTEARQTQYLKHPETLCKSKPRLHMYHELLEMSCLPIFELESVRATLGTPVPIQKT